MRQLLAGWGLLGDEGVSLTDAVTSDDERWVDVMMLLEHGFGPTEEAPLRAGAVTFGAFVLVGFLPLMPFVIGSATGWDVTAPYAWSAVLTAAGFTVVGAVKGRVVGVGAWRSAVTTTAAGGAAAAVAFAVGALLGGLVSP